jgi:hypothetical protein
MINWWLLRNARSSIITVSTPLLACHVNYTDLKAGIVRGEVSGHRHGIA